jgi:hypothetical protein
MAQSVSAVSWPDPRADARRKGRTRRRNGIVRVTLTRRQCRSHTAYARTHGPL